MTSIGDEAFRDCYSLTSVHITDLEAWCNIKMNWEMGGSYLFHYAQHLYLNGEEIKDLVIPNSVSRIGIYVFEGCSSLTSVTIPNSVTRICHSAFRECSGLTSVTFGNSVASIDEYAFAGCSGLTSIKIPNPVMQIGSGAFSGCSGLTSVSIPSSVTSIVGGAFSGCPELLDVYCFAENVPSTDASAFNDSYIEYVTLHVPASAINDYKATAPWSGFKEVVPIEEVTLEKCATPAIAYANDELTFSCETEDVEFVYDVKVNGATSGTGNKVKVATTLTVNVYAKKEGYENSDVATKEIQPKFGDLSGDGKVDATDLTKLIEILLKR